MARGMATRRLSRRRVQVLRRRLLVGAVLALVLILAYMIWLRNSSLVAVERVEVEGVTADRERITAALVEAGDGMTTLHVRDDELRDAVAGFPTVATVSADADLPHGLTITVTERLPVAVAEVEGAQVAVSEDGYLLRGLEFDPKELPSLDPGSPTGPRLGTEGSAQAAILGGAPEEISDRLQSASWDVDRGGVVVDLDGAPELRFGGGDRVEDKWKAVAAVLGDPDLGSSSYVDVSVPERPVSG
jgi:cell division protein FtsQ